MAITFDSLDDAYQRASWASGRICTDGVYGKELTEAVRVHQAASVYIVKAEGLAVSSREKIVSIRESFITPAHIKSGHAAQQMTLQAKLDIATARYLKYVAEHDGMVISTMLYYNVTVADLGGLSDNRHKYRMRAVLESGLLSRHKIGRNYMLTLTDKGRRWLREHDA